MYGFERVPFQNPQRPALNRSLALDHFIVFGEMHLRHLTSSYLGRYHRLRPHQGLNSLRIGIEKPPDLVESLGWDELICHERLGGLLKHYERKAA